MENPCFSQEKDAALWTAIGINKDFSKNFKAEVGIGYRLNNNMQIFEKAYIEAGVSYRINSFFKISADYRYENKNNFLEDYISERNRFTLAWQNRFKTDNFRFYWTIKYQHKFTDNYEANGVYIEYDYHLRNKFKIEYNKKKSDFTPYLFYESYTPLDYNSVFRYGFDQHRFQIGTDYNIAKKHKLNIFFMYIADIKPEANLQEYIYGIEYHLSL
jgi:long-subunit fatty acid transport protein